MDAKSLPAFAGLNATQLTNFLAATRPVEIKEGTQLFTHGALAEDLFFFNQGELRVSIDSQELAVVPAPCIIGELELFTERPSVATVTALRACTGIAIKATDLRLRLADGDTAALKVIHNIAQVVARRLAAMDQKVTELLERHGDAPSKDLQALKAKLFGEWS